MVQTPLNKIIVILSLCLRLFVCHTQIHRHICLYVYIYIEWYTYIYTYRDFGLYNDVIIIQYGKYTHTCYPRWDITQLKQMYKINT